MSSGETSTIHFPPAVPRFTVPDVVRTAEYYRDVLGFQIGGYWSTPPTFGVVWRDKMELFLNRDAQPQLPTGPSPGTYDAYFRVTGVEALAAELRARGAEILDGPNGRRELVIRDCNGRVVAFGEDPRRRLLICAL